ncbi:hypothetical protein CK203_110991 [Vitis vinifera]|uniref:CCHC-type domain-containing protein n=1 Tax=Vitis vinifera TaxID=29760 RepID=A0A438CE81_VITVI|nr:hypothetical protein CK203_110991 [Vitis vinifera]
MRVKGLEEEGSLLEETFLKMNLHLMVTRRDGKRKERLGVFQCKKPGHIKYDCPLYKNEAKRRKKKAMMATWSESEDQSSEEENEKEMANMCSMAIDELDEVNSNLSDEDIHDAFEECMRILKNLV